MDDDDSERPEPISKATITAVGGTLVTGTVPLVFPQIPIEAGVALWTIAGSLFLYAGRDWIRARLPRRWRKRKDTGAFRLGAPDRPTGKRKRVHTPEEALAIVNMARGAETDFSRAGQAVRGNWWEETLNWPATGRPRSQAPQFDMTLNDLVRRVAFHSQWAADFSPDTPATQWQKTFWWKPLSKEIFRALVGGDVKARGILNRRGEEPDTGPTEIPIDFWRKADFAPELMLTEPTINSAGNGQRGEIYTDIEVRSSDVNQLWRRRTAKSMKQKPSPFLAWHKEWWEEQEDARIDHAVQLEKQIEQARPTEKPWHEGRTRLTIREAGCLAAGVSLRDFDGSDHAQSKANELLYYVDVGMVPIAGGAVGSGARRSLKKMGVEVPPVNLDTYVTKRDLDAFRQNSAHTWWPIVDDLNAKNS